MTNPYEVLGLESGASADAVKGHYRKLAKRYHPDRNEGDPSAAWMFRQVKDAYDTIESRRRDNPRPQAPNPRAPAAPDPGNQNPFDWDAKRWQERWWRATDREGGNRYRRDTRSRPLVSFNTVTILIAISMAHVLWQDITGTTQPWVSAVLIMCLAAAGLTFMFRNR